jgi:hypothetical protein
MKKFFFSILAVGALVACTKSEVKFDGETEIAFAPVSSVNTKVVGAIESTTYPTAENFLVWAYWQDVPAGSDKNAFTAATTYIDCKEFKNANNKLWKGAEKSYYWPKTGSLVFACVSPADAPFMDGYKPSHTLAGEFTFNYANSNNTAETRDLLWANCAASYNEATAGVNGVPVEFRHALAWITFRVKGNGAAQGDYTINSLTLNQVMTGAHFKSAGNGSWESHMTPLNYEVFTGSQALTASLVDLETNPRGTLVIPQTQTADYTATLKYTNATGDNPINETIELKLGTAWEIGKHYIYEITFSPKEILIAPVVEDWVEVKMPIEY